MTDKTQPDSGRATGGIVEMLHARIAELEARVQELGAMARENRSRRIVELEAQLEAVGAARAEAASVLEDAARWTTEQEHAIRQGHEIAASDGYFEARPWVEDNSARRKVFQAGFERGWDAARKQAAPKAAPGEPGWWRKRADEIEAKVALTGNQEAMRCYTDMRALLQAAACDTPSYCRSVQRCTAQDEERAKAAPKGAPVVAFKDARVQAVYNILVDDEAPPAGEHWEGFIARRIVDALADAKAAPTWPSEALAWEALQAYLKHDTNMEGMRAALIVGAAPQQEAQEPCQTCTAMARTVMMDQVSFDRKPDCYGIRQITDDDGIEEWEDIRTSPDVAREEANDMMATGRGEIYEVVPLWTTPQPAPAPLSDDTERLREALQRIEGASMSMYATRSDMLEHCQDIARAALAAQKGKE